LLDSSTGFNIVPWERDGKLRLISNECVFAISNFQIHFWGAGSGTLNGFISYFKGFIQDAIQDEVCPQLENGINDKANIALWNLPMVSKVGPLQIDYSLVATPVIEARTWLSVGLVMDVEASTNPQPCPYSPPQLPISTLNATMLEVYLSESVLDCTAYVLFGEGLIQATVTAKTVPPSDAYLLNTDTYELIVPPLYADYPDTNMSVHVMAIEAPKVFFDLTGVQVKIGGEVKVSVLDPAPKEVLALGAAINLDVKVWFDDTDGTILHALIHSMVCNFTLINSTVGDFEFELLDEFLQEACTQIVPPVFNQYFANGFLVPSYQGFTLIDPIINYGDGYLGLISSLSYVEPNSTFTGTDITDPNTW